MKHRGNGRGRGWHAQRGRLGWAAAFVATVLLTMLVGSLVSGGGNGSSGPSSLSRPARRTPPASKPAAPPNVAAQPIAAIEPVSSDARGARFAVNQLPFTLTMVAKGSCWVQVRQGDGGPVVFEATLQAGQTKTVDGTGNLFLRLGNPNNVALDDRRASGQHVGRAGYSVQRRVPGVMTRGAVAGTAWSCGDSNPGPLPCHGSALPPELQPPERSKLPAAPRRPPQDERS